nr:hypothetical protein [Tanacetum cinerariifolium]
MLGVFENDVYQMRHDALARRHITLRTSSIGNTSPAKVLLKPSSSPSTKTLSSPLQWVNLFQTNENVYRELVREFFASFKFDASPCRYEPNHLGVRFRLGASKRRFLF